MDKHRPITDRLTLLAGHVRLLADLMIAGPDLQDVQSDAFALVLQDLAVRLEQVAEESEHCGHCPLRRERRGRS